MFTTTSARQVVDTWMENSETWFLPPGSKRDAVDKTLTEQFSRHLKKKFRNYIMLQLRNNII